MILRHIVYVIAFILQKRLTITFNRQNLEIMHLQNGGADCAATFHDADG